MFRLEQEIYCEIRSVRKKNSVQKFATYWIYLVIDTFIS